jgi:hypothetical protein
MYLLVTQCDMDRLESFIYSRCSIPFGRVHGSDMHVKEATDVVALHQDR